MVVTGQWLDLFSIEIRILKGSLQALLSSLLPILLYFLKLTFLFVKRGFRLLYSKEKKKTCIWVPPKIWAVVEMCFIFFTYLMSSIATLHTQYSLRGATSLPTQQLFLQSQVSFARSGNRIKCPGTSLCVEPARTLLCVMRHSCALLLSRMLASASALRPSVKIQLQKYTFHFTFREAKCLSKPPEVSPRVLEHHVPCSILSKH